MRDRIGSGLSHTVVAVALSGLVAFGCGGGGGGDDDVPPGGPPSDGVPTGFFVGETNQGEPLAFEIGSIHTVYVQCGNDPKFSIVQNFDEPKDIATDGSFTVDVENEDQLRHVNVSGRFVNDNFIQGTITGDPFCEGPFEAERCNDADPKCRDGNGDHIPDGLGGTPTPSPTPKPTPTRSLTPSATALTPTPTPTITPTPTATPTVTPQGEPQDRCGDGEVGNEEQCDPADTDFDPDCSFHCQETDGGDNGGTARCRNDCTIDFGRCTGVECEP